MSHSAENRVFPQLGGVSPNGLRHGVQKSIQGLKILLHNSSACPEVLPPGGRYGNRCVSGFKGSGAFIALLLTICPPKATAYGDVGSFCLFASYDDCVTMSRGLVGDGYVKQASDTILDLVILFSLKMPA